MCGFSVSLLNCQGLRLRQADKLIWLGIRQIQIEAMKKKGNFLENLFSSSCPNAKIRQKKELESVSKALLKKGYQEEVSTPQKQGRGEIPRMQSRMGYLLHPAGKETESAVSQPQLFMSLEDREKRTGMSIIRKLQKARAINNHHFPGWQFGIDIPFLALPSCYPCCQVQRMDHVTLTSKFGKVILLCFKVPKTPTDFH